MCVWGGGTKTKDIMEASPGVIYKSLLQRGRYITMLGEFQYIFPVFVGGGGGLLLSVRVISRHICVFLSLVIILVVICDIYVNFLYVHIKFATQH